MVPGQVRGCGSSQGPQRGVGLDTMIQPAAIKKKIILYICVMDRRDRPETCHRLDYPNHNIKKPPDI